MNDSISGFRGQLTSFLSNLNMRQKIILFTGAAIGLAVVLIIMVWSNSPRYEVLYSQLAQKDAGQIIEKLRELKVKYQLEEGGTTIMVPSDKVYELRLQLARDGMPENSLVGYEIFDKSNLGMTDFIQKVNYRRALEGELTRTISQIEEVEKARVHIVIPEESLFKEDQKQPTASVILKLKGNRRLNSAQIYGIVHLLASSVEGLEPENVTVVDSRGRILSENQDPNNLIAMSASQLEYKKKVEDYLSHKAQTMLDQVLGPGNAVVRVTTELNFTQVEKTMEQYDPDNTVIRSEEIQEQVSPTSAENSNSSGNARTSNTITNYEVNKTVQHIVENVGNISRLSVAVLINNKRKQVTTPEGTPELKTVKRTPQELQTLENLIKRAVGFQEERQDQFSITNVDFNVPPESGPFVSDDKGTPWNNYYNIIEKVFLVLAILFSMIIMRSIFTQVKQRSEEIQTQILQLEQQRMARQLPPGAAARAALPQMPGGDAELAEDSETDNSIIYANEFFKVNTPQNQFSSAIRNFIKQSPDEAARLIKVWLVDEAEDSDAKEEAH